MDDALRDEYLAYMTYSRILEHFGEVYPFANIVHAEARHIAALATLYESRGLPAPENPWTQDDLPVYASLRDACAAGVEGEQRNIALYDRWLAMDLPADVRFVFENLQRASRENHLAAFRRCLDRWRTRDGHDSWR
jgi:hypothetical protein